jgi:uncharacterized protein YndB with AHSA1/START domain
MLSTDTLTVERSGEREIVMTRTFDAPRQKVFDAWTKPDQPPRWMRGPEGWTMPVCEIDLRPGGAWRFVWRMPDGNEMTMRGVYREVAPPERLVSTEAWGGDWPETLNTLSLSEANGRTTAAVRILYASPETREKALGTGMPKGVAASYDRLARILAES